MCTWNCLALEIFHLYKQIPVKQVPVKQSVSIFLINRASLVAQTVKNLPAMQETWVWSLGWEDPLKRMATLSSILAWRTPWTKEPGRLQSIGSQRVRHDWAINTFGPSRGHLRTRPSFSLSQSLPSGSFHKPLILLHQRTDTLKPYSQKTS